MIKVRVILKTQDVDNIHNIFNKIIDENGLEFELLEGSLGENIFFNRVNINTFEYFNEFLRRTFVSVINNRIFLSLNSFQGERKLRFNFSWIKNSQGLYYTDWILKPITKEYHQFFHDLSSAYLKGSIDEFKVEIDRITDILIRFNNRSFLDYFFIAICYFFKDRIKKSKTYFEYALLKAPNEQAKKFIINFIAELDRFRSSIKDRIEICIVRSDIYNHDPKQIDNVISTIKSNVPSNFKIKVEKTICYNSINALIQQLIKNDVNQIIFIGHGNENKGFIANLENNNEKFIQRDLIFELSKKIRTKNLGFIIMHSCEGHYYVNDKIVSKFIYSSDTTSNQSAEAYLAGFYKALTSNSSITDAHQFGKLVLALRSQKYYNCHLLNS